MPLDVEDAFAAVNHYVYIREAETEDGTPGFALIDSDGHLELFSEYRSNLFYYVAANELHVIQLN